MKSMSLRCAVLIAVLSLLSSCGGGGTPGTTIQRITSSGGRVAWYKGTAAAHSKIAFDAIVSNSFVFISSRANPAWQAPADNAGTLRTELYIQKGATIQQLTSFNANGDPNKRYLTSDYDWDRTGQRIVVQVAPVDNVTGAAYPPEIWMITFPEPQ